MTEWEELEQLFKKGVGDPKRVYSTDIVIGGTRKEAQEWCAIMGLPQYCVRIVVPLGVHPSNIHFVGTADKRVDWPDLLKRAKMIVDQGGEVILWK